MMLGQVKWFTRGAPSVVKPAMRQYVGMILMFQFVNFFLSEPCARAPCWLQAGAPSVRGLYLLCMSVR